MAVMYASVEAVAEQWRPLDTRETASAVRLLDRVSALMRSMSPGLDARVRSDPDLASIAAGVAVDAVVRVLRNVAISSSQDASDAERMLDTSLQLTVQEIDSLMSATGADLGAGAFTIRPGGTGPDRCASWW